MARPKTRIHQEKREATSQDEIQKMFAVRMGKRSQDWRNAPIPGDNIQISSKQKCFSRTCRNAQKMF